MTKQATRSLTKTHLRLMTPADIEAVLEIEQVSFGEHHWSADSFNAEILNQMGRYYVLANLQPEGPSILGYCGCWLVLDEGHITTIATHPDWRGCSLGEVLLLHLLGWFTYRKVSWGTLEVRLSNFQAQNLYYKYGFETQGRRPRYYQDNNEDALIMTTPDIMAGEYQGFLATKRQELSKRLSHLPKGFNLHPG